MRRELCTDNPRGLNNARGVAEGIIQPEGIICAWLPPYRVLFILSHREPLNDKWMLTLLYIRHLSRQVFLAKSRQNTGGSWVQIRIFYFKKLKRFWFGFSVLSIPLHNFFCCYIQHICHVIFNNVMGITAHYALIAVRYQRPSCGAAV